MTRDDIIRMAREAGFPCDEDWVAYGLEGFERFAALVAASEREACAQVVENYAIQYDDPVWALKLTEAIKTRGEK